MSNQTLALKLSLQRALIGEVTNSLKAVTAGWEKEEVRVHFYFDDPITDDDRETASVISAEINADFDAPVTVVEQCLSWPENDLTLLEFWAYLRK